MKAAVISQEGAIPVCGEVAAPRPATPDEVLMRVRAASIKNIDRSRAAGTHYDKHKTFPAVAGIDGVGVLEDGTRVYSGFADGVIAEYAVVKQSRCIAIDDDIDDITAAALPNPGLSAWFALSYRAGIKPGDTVLIMGATGVTGKVAIQLAKYFGAGRVIATGRNPAMLAMLPALGADAVISLAQPEEQIIAELKREKAISPFDIVIDYLWGRPAEMVLDLLAGHDLNAEPHRTRFVQVGEMAGKAINLKAGLLRSSAVELYGIGGGTVPREIMKTVPTHIMPTLMRLVAEGRLKIETETVPLAEVEAAWIRGDRDGKRQVVVI